MTANEKLNDICRGILRELHQLKEALLLAEFIGTEAATLKAASFEQFFGALQIILGPALLMHAARLFDRPKGYELRSIPAATALLRKECAVLEIPGHRGMVAELGTMGVALGSVDRLSHQDLTIYVADLFDGKLTEAHIEATLEAVKTVRDKIVAHAEMVDSALILKPTFSELGNLVELAEQFLDVVWCGYENVYGSSHSDASRRTSISLHRLLQEANIQTTLPSPRSRKA